MKVLNVYNFMLFAWEVSLHVRSLKYEYMWYVLFKV